MKNLSNFRKGKSSNFSLKNKRKDLFQIKKPSKIRWSSINLDWKIKDKDNKYYKNSIKL